MTKSVSAAEKRAGPIFNKIIAAIQELEGIPVEYRLGNMLSGIRAELIEHPDTRDGVREPLPQPSPPPYCPMPQQVEMPVYSPPYPNAGQPSPPSAAPPTKVKVVTSDCAEAYLGWRDSGENRRGRPLMDAFIAGWEAFNSRVAPQPAPNAPLQTERLAADAHQLAKDFDALVVLIARTLGDKEWQDADDDQIREDFDPWDTLHKVKLAAPNPDERSQRPFCDGCDHGVAAGHVCESCGGTGYKERREGDRRKGVASQRG